MRWEIPAARDSYRLCSDLARLDSARSLKLHRTFPRKRGNTRGGLVARIERKRNPREAVPDAAQFAIGPAEGRTRWLHPGCLLSLRVGAFVASFVKRDRAIRDFQAER